MFYRSAKRTADVVCERLATVLQTPVVVVDQRDVIVAASEPDRVGFPLEPPPSRAAPPLRVPLPLEDHTWSVVILAAADAAVIAARGLEELLALLLAAPTAELPQAAELRNTLVYDLLRGVPDTGVDAERLGQILGMRLTWPRAVLLIATGESRLPAGHPTALARLQQRSEALINTITALFPEAYDPISAHIGNGEIAVLAAQPGGAGAPPAGHAPATVAAPAWNDLEALKSVATNLIIRLRYEIHGTVAVGLGRYHPGVAGVARSYRDARTALTVGLRYSGPVGLYCLDTLGILAFLGLADEETKIDLARQRLHPLDREQELIETLNAFFSENCSPSLTAARLTIHRNTLAYRFDKVTALTGLDPRRFEDAIQLRMALLLCGLGTPPP
jgi:carbohydrate diacid regulator